MTTAGTEALARDYERLHFHISFWEATGRRLRRNYSFLFAVQAVSYVVKICIHPTPVRSLDELREHASIGPLPGEVVLAIGVLFHAGLVALALLTLKGRRAVGRVWNGLPTTKTRRRICGPINACSRELLPIAKRRCNAVFFSPSQACALGSALSAAMLAGSDMGYADFLFRSAGRRTRVCIL